MAQATVPPTLLTMAAYRLEWEPAGWELMVIGPTSTWREEWGEWEAIRDLVQNALDETEGYSWGYDQEGLWLRDSGRGVAVADFLLGPPKLKPDFARGKYGEGMKIAALALLRKGYRVKVETVGRELWLVFIEVRVNGSASQLGALWRHGGRAQGTIFHIIGYFGPAYEDRFAVNIPRAHILHEGPSRLAKPIPRKNQLIAQPPGRIYARDIHMRDINSPFSYNLWGFDMAPDRHSAKSDTDIWTDMGRLWATVDNPQLIERLLGMLVRPAHEESYETDHLNLSSWLMREPLTGRNYLEFIEDNAEAWRRAWRAKFGDVMVLRTDSALDGIVMHLGYASLDFSWDVRDGLARAILTDHALVTQSQERLRQVQVVPDNKLTTQAGAHLRLARKIAVLSVTGPPKVHAAMIPPASDRTRTAGLYSRTVREIYLSLEQLERGTTTVDTVIHELAHHLSGAEDMSQEHNDAMTQMAARVVQHTAARAFDDVLAEVVW